MSLTKPNAGRHYSFAQGAALEIDCDYAIAGSGSGGSAAAIQLARAGFKVVVVEAGAWRNPQDYPHSMYGTMKEMFYDWGQLIATGDSIIPVVQARTVGGTSVINSAIVVRTPGDVLQDWKQRLGLGDVFTANSIGLAQDRIENELQVQVTPDDILGPSSAMMLDAMRKMGVDGHAISRNVANCKGAMQCLQGCRNKSKQTANFLWLRELIEEKQGSVLSCAPVDKVLIEKGQALGLQGRFQHPHTHKWASSFVIRANRGVLLAASATGTAPLLWRSGVKLPYLGNGWRGHPGAGIVGVYDKPVDMHVGPSQAAASMHYRENIGIKLESLSLPLELFAARVGGAGSELMQKLSEYRNCAMWVSAVRADAVGQLRRTVFGGTALRYAPTPKDLERLRQGCKIVAQLHFAAGAKKIWPGIYGLPPEIGPNDLHLLDNAPLKNKSYTWVLSHLFGGAILGNNPNESVVAPDLHVRGVRGLHVVDASAIPTTLGVNPQHTIMALAMVTADRLIADGAATTANATQVAIGG